MKRTTTAPAGGLAARVAALEAEITRVKALAEGAQRAAFRIAWKFEALGGSFRSLVMESESDELGLFSALSESIADEEHERAERIADGEEA